LTRNPLKIIKYLANFVFICENYIVLLQKRNAVDKQATDLYDKFFGGRFFVAEWGNR